MDKPSLKMSAWSIRIAIAVFAILLLVMALAKFNVIDLQGWNKDVLTFGAVIIIFIEVGLAQLIKNKGKGLDFFSFIGVFAGLLTLLTWILQLLSVVSTALDGIQGFVFAALVISFGIEALR